MMFVSRRKVPFWPRPLRAPFDAMPMTNRQWLAWNLNRLSHKIYDATYYEAVSFVDQAGITSQMVIQNNEYGGGIQTASGPIIDHIIEFETEDEAYQYVNDRIKP